MTSNNSAPAPSANELMKAAHPTLEGTIAPTLANPEVDHFSEEDNQFLKFHGVYQQDDRDLRKTFKKYILMVRVRIPGGILAPAQYLALDELSTLHANNTLRITSRQAIQFHGVVKKNLVQTIQGINQVLLTTIAACGDVVRNVMAPPTPATDGVAEHILDSARRLSKILAPTTPAYHEIWLDGKELDLEKPADTEFADPLYGQTYLPRKFKIAFAIPPINDVDVLTNCVGLIAIVENGSLMGYNLSVGGGMGRSHNNPDTFPRVADVAGFITPEQVDEAVRAVVTIHRDFGDRSNRKHARLKYILADRGIDWFREEFSKRAGFALQTARPYTFTRQGDAFGWQQQTNGKWYLGLFVETGRIRDNGSRKLKTALRKIVEEFQPEIHLTPGNNMLLVNIPGALREPINKILAEHGIPVENQGSPLRRASMACVSLPTCGLGLAESERYLPSLITRIEELLTELGLGDLEIITRMTGCPNGCARPYMAEIGLVGKAPGRYQLYLGGDEGGTRLNRLYKDTVKDVDIVNELRPLLARYGSERQNGERFGDWAARVLWNEPAAAA